MCGALEAEGFIQEIFIVCDVGALDLFTALITALFFLQSGGFFCVHFLFGKTFAFGKILRTSAINSFFPRYPSLFSFFLFGSRILTPNKSTDPVRVPVRVRTELVRKNTAVCFETTGSIFWGS